MKRIWKLIVAMLALICLAGCIGENATTGKNVNGEVGDTLSNMFFDWTVNSVESLEEYEGYAASKGCQLLVCNMAVDNTFGDTLPMLNSDFQIQWGTDDSDYAWAIDPYNERMMPLEWDLEADKNATYDLVFEVPEDLNSFVIVYLEQYIDGDGNNGTGDLFAIQFDV